MPAIRKDSDAKAIAALPWVATVEKINPPKHMKNEDFGYMVVTKPDALKVKVTHGIYKNREHYYIGKELQEPIMIPMPSLKIKVFSRIGGVTVAMADKPELKHLYMLIYPSADCHLTTSNWDYPLSPCWGEYWGTYPDTYAERAEFLADYIQHSVAHSSLNRGGSRWAMFLGLMPEKYIIEDEEIHDDVYIEGIGMDEAEDWYD